MRFFLSLDFWNTIAYPNPVWPAIRARAIANVLGCTPEVAAASYQAAKHFIDGTALRTGRGLSTTQAWNLLAISITGTDAHGGTVKAHVNHLFFDNGPIVHSEVLEALPKLADRGMAWGISSNSNFIAGSTILEYLEERLNILPPKIALFSDRLLYAKPSPVFYGELINHVVREYGITSNMISHVGDDEDTDGACLKMGINFKRITPLSPLQVYLRDRMATNKMLGVKA